MSIRISVAAVVLFIANFQLLAADDPSGPKATAVAFGKALVAGDAKTARSLAIGDEKELQLVDVLTDMVTAMRELGKAAIAKYGDDGKRLGSDNPVEQLATAFDNAEEKIDGDTATVAGRIDPEPMRLKKADGQWKVDLSALPNKSGLIEAIPSLKTMATVVRETAADISAGKYATPVEAEQAMLIRIQAALRPPKKAATKPADPGATTTTRPSEE